MHAFRRSLLFMLFPMLSILPRAEAQWTQASIPVALHAPVFTTIGSSVFLGLGTTGGGIFRTVNNGATWSLADSGVAGVTAGWITGMSSVDGFLFAGTTDGLLRSADSGKSWQIPATGVTCCMNVIVKANGDLFAGARGLFHSTDDGGHWNEVDAGMGTPVVRALVSSGAYLVAGTQDTGIFRTSNKGVSWTTANSGFPANSNHVPVTALVFNNGKLFAARGGLGHGIYISSNDGTTWTDGGSGMTDSVVNTLIVFNNTLFAGTAGAGVSRSTNNGTSWNASNNGLTNLSVYAMISRGTALFAATPDGVYVSADSGATWSIANTGLSTVSAVPAFAIGTTKFYATANGPGVLLSNDAGKNWTKADSGSFGALMLDGATLYAANVFGNVWTSPNDGATWTLSNSGLSGAIIRAFASTSTSKFAGADHGAYKSTDNGGSWSNASSDLADSVTTLLVIGSSVYAGTNTGVYRSINDGANWTAVNNGLSKKNVTVLAINSGTLFAGTTHGGVFQSTNGGALWTSISTGIDTNGSVEAFAFIGTRMFAGSTVRGVYYSSDNGAHWSTGNAGYRLPSPFTPLTTDTTVRALSISITDSTLLAGTSNGIWRRPLSDFPAAPAPPDTIGIHLVFTNTVAWLTPATVTIAESNPAASSQLPAKICADGSTTTVRLTCDKGLFSSIAGKVILQIAGVSDSAVNGWFGASVQDTGGMTIVLHHPRSYIASPAMMPLTLQVIDTVSKKTIYTYPLQVYRTPLLLVPGLAANATSMRGLANHLIHTLAKYPLAQSARDTISGSDSPLLFFADYIATANDGFAANADVVYNATARVIAAIRQLGYSAGSVDVAAHSLGGVLARLYLQDTRYRGEVHRLITVNAPHAGTQFATWAARHRALFLGPLAEVREWFLEGGLDLAGDAMRDLDATGTAILSTLNGASLNRNRVPSFTVVTRAPDSSRSDDIDEALKEFMASYQRLSSADSLMPMLFNSEPNDFLVPVSSQTGGIAKTHTVTGQNHFSLDNAEVRSTIASALDGDPSGVCDTGGFHPTALAYVLGAAKAQTGASTQSIPSSSLSIVKPARGATAAAGDSITIVVAGTEEVPRFALLVHAAAHFRASLFHGSTGTYQYVLPIDSSGGLSVLAVSADSTGVYGQDTLHCGVRVGVSLITLGSPTPNVLVRQNHVAGFQVLGNFVDSGIIDVTNDAVLNVSVRDTTVAVLVGQCLLRGVRPDTTSLFITEHGVSTTILVMVTPDTGVGISEHGEPAVPRASTLGTLDIFPNPSNGVPAITFALHHEATAHVTVTNILGNVVMQTEEIRFATGVHTLVVPTGLLRSGVYRCTVTAGGEWKSRVLIVED